jgi:beta-mannosidase
VDWAYVCRFPTPAGIGGPAYLRFEGLDTLADGCLNGQALGHFENMFRFDINGRPVFLRGGDWVPVEGATHVWRPERAERLLELAEHGNMNILRIWGEGELPPQSFYDECDRRGICIWQDFMFGYYDHRKGDAAFLENCRAEVEGMIRRLRNHPSILLWVGGNEQYLWSSPSNVPEARREIFEQLMPDCCKRLEPARLFHASSPFGGPTGNWALEGDWHDYTTINFAPQASVPLFASEVLRASVPSLGSMRRFLIEEEIWPKGFDPAVRRPGQPAWPPAWTYHSTGTSTWERVGAVQEFCDPASAEELIRVIGTAHGEYLRERIERERRGAPDGNRRCWGNIVWRLNDSWPMIYSSVIDYYLEPKIAIRKGKTLCHGIVEADITVGRATGGAPTRSSPAAATPGTCARTAPDWGRKSWPIAKQSTTWSGW